MTSGYLMRFCWRERLSNQDKSRVERYAAEAGEKSFTVVNSGTGLKRSTATIRKSKKVKRQQFFDGRQDRDRLGYRSRRARDRSARKPQGL